LSTAAYPPSALREIVAPWFYTLEEDVLAEGTIQPDDAEALATGVDALLERRLADVARTTPAFAAALRAYRHATLAGDQATAESLIARRDRAPSACLLSLDERRRAEQAFAEGRDCVIVSTSALELGMDVGDLDRVIQVNSPPTVAAFLQRPGRSGRRPGTIRSCLFLALNEDELRPGDVHRGRRPARRLVPAAVGRAGRPARVTGRTSRPPVPRGTSGTAPTAETGQRSARLLH